MRQDPSDMRQIWGVEDIITYSGMTDRYLRMLRAAKLFPEPLAFHGRSPKWKKSDVLKWFETEWSKACTRLAKQRKVVVQVIEEPATKATTKKTAASR